MDLLKFTGFDTNRNKSLSNENKKLEDILCSEVITHFHEIYEIFSKRDLQELLKDSIID